MNERIEELAQGCFEYFGGTDIVEFNYKKFAELIVQECLMKAIGAKIRGESIDTLIQNIKEDFGVK
jgi:HEPN domain-containing protein